LIDFKDIGKAAIDRLYNDEKYNFFKTLTLKNIVDIFHNPELKTTLRHFGNMVKIPVDHVGEKALMKIEFKLDKNQVITAFEHLEIITIDYAFQKHPALFEDAELKSTVQTAEEREIAMLPFKDNFSL